MKEYLFYILQITLSLFNIDIIINIIVVLFMISAFPSVHFVF